MQIMQNSNPGATLGSIGWRCAHQGPHANQSRPQSSYSAYYDKKPRPNNSEFGAKSCSMPLFSCISSNSKQ